MIIDYDGTGGREATATAYTLMLYEQEFKSSDVKGITGDLIADVYGTIDLKRARSQYDAMGNLVVLDYTSDNWNAYLRALWAMLRTASESARSRGIDAQLTPRFNEWVRGVGQVNMSEVMDAVIEECNRGFFRAREASQEEAGDGGEA